MTSSNHYVGKKLLSHLRQYLRLYICHYEEGDLTVAKSHLQLQKFDCINDDCKYNFKIVNIIAIIKLHLISETKFATSFELVKIMVVYIVTNMVATFKADEFMYYPNLTNSYVC